MVTAHWMLVTFCGMFLLLFPMIPVQTASNHRHGDLDDITLAFIFQAPKIAEEKCPTGQTWIDGKCRINC